MSLQLPPEPFLVLASASPRRRHLLKRAGARFVVAPVDVAEDLAEACLWERVGDLAAAQALSKACARAALGVEVPAGVSGGSVLILAADTLVIPQGGRPLGKPRDRGDARAMLERLEGARHRVVTGVALHGLRGETRAFAVESLVSLGPFVPGELDAYLEAGLWRDKAGAYGIQDHPTLVRELRGSRSNVIGLPLEALADALRS